MYIVRQVPTCCAIYRYWYNERKWKKPLNTVISLAEEENQQEMKAGKRQNEE